MVEKIKDNPDNIIFISDLHLSHNKEFVYKDRGFDSPESHDSFIFNCLNNIPDKQNKILFNLGDICLSSNQYFNFTKLSNISFKNHYFLWGNHNAGAKDAYVQAKKDNNIPEYLEAYPIKYNNITFVGNIYNVFLNNIFFVLCHFPIQVWEDCNKNSFHLCGHSHGSNPSSNLSSSVGKILDVGVDVALKYTNNKRIYFTLTDILNILSNKKDGSDAK
jgi:calcineurin-like phosphoesterase family protein